MNVCVYTILLGDYEDLSHQVVAKQSTIPFICLTDNPELQSDCWQIRLISPMFAMDPIRSQRDAKIRPHVYLRDFDCSLYIDNSVSLKVVPEKIIEHYSFGDGLCLPWHSYRETVLDEFIEVASIGIDDQTRIFEQLNHYALECPALLQERPFWSGIMLRVHGSAKAKAFAENWAAHLHRYSRRDQLSINHATWKAELRPKIIEIDASASWFHDWPVTSGRDRNKGMRPLAVSLSPAIARVRQAEIEIREYQRRIDAYERDVRKGQDVANERNRLIVEKGALLNEVTAIKASSIFKVAAAISPATRKFPRLTRWIRRCLQLFWWLVTFQLHRRLPASFSNHPQRNRDKTG